MPIHNPECGGAHCTDPKGQVRVLPTGGDSNAILCRSCYIHEMQWRAQRNLELAADCRFKLPLWTDLKIYGDE